MRAAVRHRAVRRALERRRGTTTARRLLVRPASGVALSANERQHRLERIEAYLVRTMRSCPAPGVAPFTMRDWLVILAFALGPYLLVYGLAALAATR